MGGRRAARVVVATVLFLQLAGCGEAPGPRVESALPDAPRPPLIVITLDTTRADHLSCYGYPVQTTPALDRRAESALRFLRAYAPMAQTLPSHASLFTGLGPRRHGVTDNHRSLAPSLGTLAEQLSSAGYDTAGFVASAVLQAESGIAQGFESFDETQHDGGNRRHIERDAQAVTDAALTWLTAREDDRPPFLWVHYFDPHLPYEAPDALMHSLDVDPIVDLLADGPLDSDLMALYWRAYDAEIRYVDHHLERLFAGLDAAGLTDDAVVLVVGDHGEGLFEHEERGHGVNLFEELVRVPLLLWSPGGELAGEVVAEPMALGDIHDVLLQLCLGGDAERSSTTLWDELLHDGRLRPAPVFLERPHYSKKHLRERGGKDDPERYTHGEMVGVVAGQLKLIIGADGREQLFDLANDPAELIDISEQRPGDVARLRALLDDWRDELPFSGSDAVVEPLSEARREALLQLGYGH